MIVAVPPATSGRSRALVAAVPLAAAAGVLLAIFAAREQHRNGRSALFLVSDLVPGVTMMAAGFMIRSRRPQNRCWWLVFAAGCAWYVGDFEHSLNRDVSLAGFAFGRWHDAFLGWAVLAFPTGRLLHGYSRLLVGAIVGLFALRSASRLLLFVPPDVAGYGVRNRFVPITDNRWWLGIEDMFAWAFPAAMLLVLASVVHRWVLSSSPGRRALSPALLAAAILAAAVVEEYVVGWNGRLVPNSELRSAYVVWWAHAVLAVALAAGLVRLRRVRSAVVDLVAELGDGAPPDRLGEALGRALGDPSLTLLPWSDQASSYVDQNGHPVDLSVDRPARAVTRIERQGVPMAALVHDVALLEDPGLVNAVVAAVRLTIDNDQLQAEIVDQLAEVAASRSRIMAAGDAERHRIERDLHDGAQQRLVTIALRLRLAENRLGADGDPHIRAVLDDAAHDLAEAINELRDLARGIHPAVLTEFGLGTALQALVNRSPLPVDLDLQLDDDPPRAVAATAYFAVSEALANIVKHADAHAVTVRAVTVAGTIHIEVADDGCGGADTNSGSGLRGIADRVATVGGTLRLDSPVGGGTRFELELPCAL